MSALSQYNPIKSITIPGVELTEVKGIVVIVGPNSSGKTLFLQDIEKYLQKGKVDFIVCRSIVPQGPHEIEALFQDLLRLNFIRPMANPPAGNPNDAYQLNLPEMGINSRLTIKQPTPRPQFTLAKLRKDCENLSGNLDEAKSYFNSIGEAFVAALSLEERLKVCDGALNFDHDKQPPAFPIQGLSINTAAMDSLEQETINVFANAAWLDNSRPNELKLRVSGRPTSPPVNEMKNPVSAKKYREIETEGDGYRSYVGICMSLLLAVRPIALIDEPELCLHPPQAYHIGRFIGLHASENTRITFVVTHSSHVLRGLLKTATDTKLSIVRMSRKGGGFFGHTISETDLIKRIQNPRSRAEAVLDGLFSQGVVLVESDGDREEYQAASEAVKGYAAMEIHFLQVGGTGGFAEPARFYRSLNIPAAIVVDLDAICEPDTVRSWLQVLCKEPDRVKSIAGMVRDLVRKIKELRPPITENEVTERLTELANQELDWQKNDDQRVERSLSELRSRVKRVRKLKEGGVAAYSGYPQIKCGLENVIRDCREFGLFFVPGGELESWIPELMSDCPKGISKTERAAIAASRIREAECKLGDVWEFMQAVFDFLRTQREMV